jgi:hypothetical protein
MNSRFLMSLGTGIAATRAAQILTHVTFNDVLGIVGLERRRSTTVENVALIGLGVVVGAGAALLLAPTDGEETRRRVSDNLGKARDAGMKLVSDAKEHAPDLIESAKHKLRDVEAHANQRHHA